MRETIAVAAAAALLTVGAREARSQDGPPGQITGAVAGAAPHEGVTARTRSLDVSGFAGLMAFGHDIELGNSWAPEQVPHTSVLLGGRAGLTLLPDLMPSSTLDPQLGVEGELDLTLSSTGESNRGGRPSYFSPVFGWRIQAIARLRTANAITPHLVVGVGGATVWTGSPFMGDDTDAAFHWGLGATWKASPTWTARLDLRHGLTAGRVAYITSTFELQLGLEKSWGLGGKHVEKRPPPPPPDTDGDGILDPDDQCVTDPETRNGYQDEDGCPDDPDPDHDGIVGSQDQCPTDPEDLDGFEDADGCPDADNDKDNIPDATDGCPLEPEDVDQFQDDDGCPEIDNDNDMIPDELDPCPLEPENLNGFQDTDGCPDEIPAVVKKFTGVIKGITFAYNRARIMPSSRKVLNAAAEVLREYPDLRVRIEGHTDPKGVYEKNKKLSLRRAEAVKWYLVDQGIAADRIETEGWGPDKPIASNKTKAGRAKNRRIEFSLIAAEEGQPSAPATQPSAPATQPTAPATQPSAPATQPSAPATQPSAPATQPTIRRSSNPCDGG